MAEKTLKKTIQELLKADTFDLENAVDIYMRYGKNKNLANHVVRSPKRYERRLRWELSKMIGISLQEFNGAAGNSEKGAYPDVIDRIKKELYTLIKDQAELQKKLTNLGDANDEKTKKLSVEYGKAIDALAFRFDMLSKAKELYFNKGVIPDESELYPSNNADEDKENFGLAKMKPADIMKRRSNLVSSITKDQNRIKYQSDKKQEQENPMPEGDKRSKIEERLEQKHEELKAIDEFLNDNQ